MDDLVEKLISFAVMAAFMMLVTSLFLCSIGLFVIVVMTLLGH